MVLFEFLRNTRDRNVLPLAEEAIKATPPDRVDELLAHLLNVWTKRKDPTSRFAREHAAKLSGIRKIKRKECETVTADLHAVPECFVQIVDRSQLQCQRLPTPRFGHPDGARALRAGRLGRRVAGFVDLPGEPGRLG